MWTNQPDFTEHRVRCYSNRTRHLMCIFGVEDLKPNLLKLPQLYVNKLMPSVDFGAITCWLELLFNRTHHDSASLSRLNRTFYESQPHVSGASGIPGTKRTLRERTTFQVRFQALKDGNGEVSPEKLDSFRCD